MSTKCGNGEFDHAPLAKLSNVKIQYNTFLTKKPGGRAGLRKFARATRSMFGSVRAARAPQDDSLCFVLGR